ncbi:glycosyl transferase group 1 [Beutenbergia cavernae DSM 12333]|uniref:D-inositol 3-phosphate glycosyltransferase n=1 Tax=Beutenbergia cavernae (strain ATCC BAA-8 / DSM 12333 / CCUG 43141 / JCM 11478 / NBRC 16432 / NCIMB 13614 / HKI 0122) TaxID=471853 RepID=C5C028_BEUC1|nr:glycosyl transferase group 1 [Beutenbergia cavernae DSM 12333]
MLHVTACYDGGVRSAIDRLVELTPEWDHHLLFGGGARREAPSEDLASVERLRPSSVSRVADVRAAVRRVGADVVHAHSSLAGIYARLGVVPGTPVLYQPHGFAFEDHRRSPLGRGAIRAVESVLAPLAAAVVTVSDHERRLATRLGTTRAVRTVHNVPSVRIRAGRPGRVAGEPPLVVTLGRVCPQKDPAFFAGVADAVRDLAPAVRFAWIGDGDADLRERLEASGVTVLGWRSGRDLEAALDAADVYLHPAAYEGFPIAVLDAAARALPVVVRDIPPFDGTGLATVRTPAEAARSIVGLLTDAAAADRVHRATQRVLDVMNTDTARAAAVRLYAEVTASPQLVPVEPPVLAGDA